MHQQQQQQQQQRWRRVQYFECNIILLLLQGVATAYDSDGEPQDNTSVEHMVSTLSTPRSGK